MEYIEVITDAVTGKQVTRELSEKEIAELTKLPPKEYQETLRVKAYTLEADPLFFKWQVGEATKEQWEAKRQEIKERFPYEDSVR